MSRLPKYWNRSEKKKRKKSIKQEDRVAKKLGGRRQKASGALPGHRGDVRMPELLVEAKRTDNQSISIKLSYLEKITREAISCDCIPACAIEFGGTPPLVDKDWILVPSAFLRELLDAYRGEEDD